MTWCGQKFQMYVNEFIKIDIYMANVYLILIAYQIINE